MRRTTRSLYRMKRGGRKRLSSTSRAFPLTRDSQFSDPASCLCRQIMAKAQSLLRRRRATLKTLILRMLSPWRRRGSWKDPRPSAPIPISSSGMRCSRIFWKCSTCPPRRTSGVSATFGSWLSSFFCSVTRSYATEWPATLPAVSPPPSRLLRSCSNRQTFLSPDQCSRRNAHCILN